MIQHYVNRHKGDKFVVCGTGKSLADITVNDFMSHRIKYTSIGVNDIHKYFMPEYLVCIDSKNSFSIDRWKNIEENQARAVFTHLNLPIKNKSALCKIEFAKRGCYDLEDPNRINKSYLSPYVAVNIAYWMGASEIYMIGVDLVNHPLRNRLKQINQDFKQLHKSLQAKGVELYNASSISLIDTVPFKSL